MTEIDPVLSDVHVNCQSLSGNKYAVSRFKFCLQDPSTSNTPYIYSEDVENSEYDDKTYNMQLYSNNRSKLQYDSDGDLILDRQNEWDTSSFTSRKKRKLDHAVKYPSQSENEEIHACDQGESRNKNVDQHSIQTSAANSTTGLTSNKSSEQSEGNIGTCHLRDKTSETTTCGSFNASDCKYTNSNSVTDECECLTDTEISPTHSNKRKINSRDNRDHSTGTNNEEFYINIKHSLATSLQDVGQQVWHGALLLSDYLIHHADSLSDKIVVDLGAGVGLTSIVAAMYAKSVYSTDTGDNVLSLNEDNIRSATTCSTLPHPLCKISVKELDWFEGLAAQQTPFGLTLDDITHIQKSDILLAADVIYDFDMIDAFFNTIKQIMIHPPSKTLYISLEKRLVFTVEDLAVTSPAYNYFCLLLDDLESDTSESNIKYKVTSHDADFQQYFQYNKTKYLELWSISSEIKDS